MRSDISYNNIIDGDEFARAQKAADDSAGLDHTQIDTQAFYVTQHYDRYSEENHKVWELLWNKRWDVLEQQASDTYLRGLRAINLVPDRVPLLWARSTTRTSRDAQSRASTSISASSPAGPRGVCRATSPPRRSSRA